MSPYWHWWFSRSIVSDSCDPMGCTSPGSSVHGISQARVLEWVAISFSRESFKPRNQTQVSCIADRFFTDWAMRESKNTQIISKHNDQEKNQQVSWTPSKLKTFVCQRTPSRKWKYKTQNEGKYLPIIHLRSDLYSEHIKNSYIIKRQITQFKNGEESE